MPQGKRANTYQEFFVYQTLFEALGAGSTQTRSINIQADSDFVCQKLTYFVENDAALTRNSAIVPLATVTIKDTGSGRDLQNEPVPIPTIFGTGEIPFILPQPRLFTKQTTVTFSVANLSSGIDYDAIYLCLIGSKIYRYSGE